MTVKPPRPTYPRINCSVPGCKRGTTRVEPGAQIVCGKCWKKAPKATRDQYARWRRKARALERKSDPRAEIAWERMGRTFDAILLLLSSPPAPEAEEMDPLMAEQLRKDGLL